MAIGFLDYSRLNNTCIDCENRIKNYNEFHIPLNDEERQKQASRCMNCGVPFCGAGQMLGRTTIGCPLHNFIPEWNKLISLGRYKEAYERLALTQSFPEFTGRVCPALCEAGCVNNINGNPVTVRDNELFLIELAYMNDWVKPIVPRNEIDKRVAVIGSGPAGLSVAIELRKRGYKVTVLEKSDRFGGLLMYGIPNMKLEKRIINRRINQMKDSNIEFINNFDVTEHPEIFKQFDAICLATGSGKERDLKLDNRDLKGIYFAKDYLASSTKGLLEGKDPLINANGKRVCVVGGGDTGNDCVATAIRQHAYSVMQLEIMPKPPLERTNQWPLWPNGLKTDYGNEEAIYRFGNDIRCFETTVSELKGYERLEGIYTSRVFFNEKREMVLVPNSTSYHDIDLLIIAMGFVGTEDKIFSTLGLDCNNGNIKANNYVARNKVFVCGDARTGQSLVVKAISDGKECAKAIDQFLRI